MRVTHTERERLSEIKNGGNFFERSNEYRNTRNNIEAEELNDEYCDNSS